MTYFIIYMAIGALIWAIFSETLLTSYERQYKQNQNWLTFKAYITLSMLLTLMFWFPLCLFLMTRIHKFYKEVGKRANKEND